MHDDNTDKSFPDDLVPTIVADYGRIYKSISILWGSKHFQEFMKTLVFDYSRITERKGFPHQVMSEFLKLQILHDRVFPEFIVGEDIWHHQI